MYAFLFAGHNVDGFEWLFRGATQFAVGRKKPLT